MSNGDLLSKTLTRSPLIAASAYAAIVIAFIAITWTELADLVGRHGEVSAASDILDRLAGRKPVGRNIASTQEVQHSGSPFVEGTTVTVAGASLLQRVSEAVAKVDGNVLSSQVDLQGTQSKAGFIDVTVTCEVDQLALHRLLYDIEAGMPFLFVDQLVAQSPVQSTAGKEGRMRVLLAVSGQWQGAR